MFRFKKIAIFFCLAMISPQLASAQDATTQPTTAPTSEPAFDPEASKFLDAIKTDNVDDVRTMLKAKPALVNTRDDSGLSVLHWGVFQSVDMVKLLLEAKADVNARDDYQGTPLQRAKTTEIVTLLLNAGADINAQDKSGMTALHMVAERGPNPVLILLLERGADMNIKNKRGLTAMDLAKRAKRESAVGFLKEKGAKSRNDDLVAAAKELILACGSGDLEKAREQIRLYPTLATTVDGAGDTPLHIAAYKGQAAIAKMLIQNGAKANVADHRGFTPLHMAANSDNAEIAKMLIARGADIHAKSEDGRTPKDIAQSMNAQKAMDVILDVEQRGEPPANQLLYALTRHKIDRLNALLKTYPELATYKYDNDVTPLHIAAAVGDKEAIEALLAKGADVNAAASNGQTPLSVAKDKNQADAMKLLQDRGAK